MLRYTYTLLYSLVGFALQRAHAVSDEAKFTILGKPATQACLLNTLLPLAAIHVMAVLCEFKQNGACVGTELSVSLLQTSSVLSLANRLAVEEPPAAHYDVIRERLDRLLENSQDRLVISVVKRFLLMMRLEQEGKGEHAKQASIDTAEGATSRGVPDTRQTNFNTGLTEPAQLPSNKPATGVTPPGTAVNTGSPTQAIGQSDSSGVRSSAFNVQQHFPLTTENVQLSKLGTLRRRRKRKRKRQRYDQISDNRNYRTISGHTLQQNISCTGRKGQNSKDKRCDNVASADQNCGPSSPTSVTESTPGMKLRLVIPGNMAMPRAGVASGDSDFHLTNHVPAHSAVHNTYDHNDNLPGYKESNVSPPCQHSKHSPQAAAVAHGKALPNPEVIPLDHQSRTRMLMYGVQDQRMSSPGDEHGFPHPIVLPKQMQYTGPPLLEAILSARPNPTGESSGQPRPRYPHKKPRIRRSRAQRRPRPVLAHLGQTRPPFGCPRPLLGHPRPPRGNPRSSVKRVAPRQPRLTVPHSVAKTPVQTEIPLANLPEGPPKLSPVSGLPGPPRLSPASGLPGPPLLSPVSMVSGTPGQPRQSPPSGAAGQIRRSPVSGVPAMPRCSPASGPTGPPRLSPPSDTSGQPRNSPVGQQLMCSEMQLPCPLRQPGPYDGQPVAHTRLPLTHQGQSVPHQEQGQLTTHQGYLVPLSHQGQPGPQQGQPIPRQGQTVPNPRLHELPNVKTGQLLSTGQARSAAASLYSQANGSILSPSHQELPRPSEMPPCYTVSIASTVQGHASPEVPHTSPTIHSSVSPYFSSGHQNVPLAFPPRNLSPNSTSDSTVRHDNRNPPPAADSPSPRCTKAHEIQVTRTPIIAVTSHRTSVARSKQVLASFLRSKVQDNQHVLQAKENQVPDVDDRPIGYDGNCALDYVAGDLDLVNEPPHPSQYNHLQVSAYKNEQQAPNHGAPILPDSKVSTGYLPTWPAKQLIATEAGIPPMPTGPGIPQRPTGPGIPHMPTGPGIPPMPTGPGIPPMPTGPGIPEMPTGPGIPQMPTGIGMPPIPTALAIPQMPIGLDIPQMPTGPGMPQMPIGPGMPPMPTGPGIPPIPTSLGIPQMPTRFGIPQMPTGSGIPQIPTGPDIPQMTKGGAPRSRVRKRKRGGLSTGSMSKQNKQTESDDSHGNIAMATDNVENTSLGEYYNSTTPAPYLSEAMLSAAALQECIRREQYQMSIARQPPIEQSKSYRKPRRTKDLSSNSRTPQQYQHMDQVYTQKNLTANNAILPVPPPKPRSKKFRILRDLLALPDESGSTGPPSIKQPIRPNTVSSVSSKEEGCSTPGAEAGTPQRVPSPGSLDNSTFLKDTVENSDFYNCILPGIIEAAQPTL